MYKTLLLLTALVATAPHAARAQNDADAVRAVLTLQADAWNKGDVTAFMQSYWQNDSLTFVGKNGPTYGWQPVLDHYKQAYPDKAAMGTLTFSDLVLKPLDREYYFVIGAWHLSRASGDVGGHFTLLFRKIDGAWKIIVDHTS
jgi:ketosteroid isomerase-like protein